MDVSTFFDADFGLELSDEPTEDRDTLKRGRQSLGLSRNYVPKWDARDEFREFFQNWSVLESLRTLFLDEFHTF